MLPKQTIVNENQTNRITHTFFTPIFFSYKMTLKKIHFQYCVSGVCTQDNNATEAKGMSIFILQSDTTYIYLRYLSKARHVWLTSRDLFLCPSLFQNSWWYSEQRNNDTKSNSSEQILISCHILGDLIMLLRYKYV